MCAKMLRMGGPGIEPTILASQASCPTNQTVKDTTVKY